MKANLSKAAGLFQAPLSKAARAVAALQDKLEKEGGPASADAAEAAEASDTAAAPAEA
jgi:large subunit ribosomal protein L10